MLFSLSIVPVVLLLIQSVISVDQHRGKRVPRRNTEVIRSLGSNHPPLIENYENVLAIDKEKNKKVSGGLKMNQPQLSSEIDLFQIMAMNDYESDIILPQKARSVNGKKTITTTNQKDNDNFKNIRKALTSSEIDTAPKSHRRRSQVRRVKVAKNELSKIINKTQSAINETESVIKEDDKKVMAQAVNQVRARTNNQPSINRRKGLRDPVVPIVESENYVFSHSGDFHYSYEGGDGTKAAERGELKTSNGGAGNAVEGSYSYIGKDGNDYSLTYTADENGYRPIGAHLPTPPPIPPAIKRALEYLATKTTPEPNTERIHLLKQGYFI
ncbi:unnamed protein product [Chrysodeixis includens]|uniref:P3 protein n=1 Tax=Chrysodeixis includens TaxID=689277 RepID=A0A9P0C186_CHRIL|nr:unnamed protein product [Chrysodeixis includens]